MSANDTDKIVAACLQDVVNKVAQETGQDPQDVQRVIDLARYVDKAEKADKTGRLAPGSARPQ